MGGSPKAEELISPGNIVTRLLSLIELESCDVDSATPFERRANENSEDPTFTSNSPVRVGVLSTTGLSYFDYTSLSVPALHFVPVGLPQISGPK